MTRSLTMHAPAKINLFLEVGAQRADGYHEVTTLLCPLALHDTLTVKTYSGAQSTSVETSYAEDIPSLEIPLDQNLVFKAAEAMRNAYQDIPQVQDTLAFHLTKRIPSGAGLGGGSSDAAATIRALSHLWELPENDTRLVQVAASLGADIPFFMYGKASLFTGRGDCFSQSFDAPEINVALVKPLSEIATTEAYATFDALVAAKEPGASLSAGTVSEKHLAALCSALTAGEDIQVARASGYNNLTEAAVELAPDVKGIFTCAADASGVLSAFLSGSGSTVAILCEDSKSARKIALDADKKGFWSAATQTVNAGAAIVAEERP